MAVVVFASNKGGVGKTTLAMNFADGLSRRVATRLIDADPQQSALQWSKVAQARGANRFQVSAIDATLDDSVYRSRQAREHVVIDCPPAFGATQSQDALGVADIVLVPMQPSPVDVWAAGHIADWLTHARKANPELKAFIVLSQVEPRTALWKGVRGVLDELGVPTLTTIIKRRAVFRNSALTGGTVFSVGEKGKEAAAEIDNLITEVLQV